MWAAASAAVPVGQSPAARIRDGSGSTTSRSAVTVHAHQRGDCVVESPSVAG
jgi:hypothetical protein